MKRHQLSILFIAATFFSLALGARSESTPAPASDTSAVRAMAKTDSVYSALSVEKGMPAACLVYFADDGIAFAPRAMNGKKFWGSQKEFPGTLMWQPVFSAASRSGDLGYTTGPWELKSQTKPSSFGNYVTIWRKDADKEWKIALDVGIDNPQPTTPPPDLQVLPADVVAGDAEAARRKFRRTALAFGESAKQDIGKALIKHAAPEIRVFRDKAFPAVGTAAAQVILGSENGKVVQKAGATNLSSSGDIAYTYGNYSEERGNMTERGIYVMIWQVDLNGDWKLVLDLRKKAP